MKNGRMEKVRIIVAFGDISGFSIFWDSITYDEAELIPWLEEFDAIIEAAEKDTGYTFDDTGDGFMLTIDFQSGDNALPVKILLAMVELLNKIEMSIEKKDPPRPGGFRIVLGLGYILWKIKRDGRVVRRGKPLNQAHNALEMARGAGILVQNNFRQLISEEQEKYYGIVFTPFIPPKVLPAGITPNEAKNYFLVHIERRKRPRK